jgi:hypothetical protein
MTQATPAEIQSLRDRLEDIRDERHFPAHMMSAHDEMLEVLDLMGKQVQAEETRALKLWENFLDTNPDGITGPEEYPDHALVTFDQFYQMIRDYIDG